MSGELKVLAAKRLEGARDAAELDARIAHFSASGVRRELALKLLLNSGIPGHELRGAFP